QFDSVLPPHKSYLGLSRRVFLILLAAAVVLVVVLIIGLAVRLTRKSKYQDLPLPSNAQTFTGDLTYYGTGLGACGVTSADGDNVVSVSHIIFDAAQKGSDPNSNPLCGLKIRAARHDEQVGARRSVDLTVVDRCTGCQPTDLDTSTGVFDKLAARASGRVDVTWAWL
ncbi:RlpA-like double-psi beta-barrel-protein domain-containing protein-containing protein, partial [Cryomyces antarcticus]